LRIGAATIVMYFFGLNVVGQKKPDRVLIDVPAAKRGRVLPVDIDPRFDIV
jgi:hypothetical protein